MKRLMTIVLSACLLTGSATVAFAQGKDAPKEDGKGKGDKGKDEKGKDGKGK